MSHYRGIASQFIRVSVIVLCLFSAGCRAQESSNQALRQASVQWGICTSPDNAQKLKDAGYDYVEAGVQGFLVPQKAEGEFQTILEKQAGSPLPVYACNSFLPSDLKCVGPEANPAGVLAYAKTAFQRAQKAGVKRIVFGSGKSRAIPEGFDRQEARRQFVSLLKEMGPLAGACEVTIVIEPLQSKETNFINTVAEGADIAKEVNHPNICVLADFYHMAMENESPDSIRNAGTLLKHCHIAEKENRMAPGTTDYDFTPYFAALKDIGYNGGVSIEGRWQDFDADLVKALATMRTQWEAAK
jgi:sugar phosphate isomerase/epimerase